MSLSIVSIPPATDALPTGVVVGLHGWGANAQDLASLASVLNLPDRLFLFPNAPFPHPYSSVGKMWYSFPQTAAESLQSQDELAASHQLLHDWLLDLPKTTNIPLERTILAGFSQGGAMTLDLGFKLPLAGLIVMSGYLHETARNSAPLAPILMIHGKQDDVVPVTAARSARSNLEAMGAEIAYHEFDMGHEIRPQVFPIIKEFITEQR